MRKDLKPVVKKFMQNEISRRDFLIEVNAIILKVPSYWKCYDKDVVHEFYAYIVSKIDRIISRYTEYKSATFNTWFLRVLNREFFFFFKKWNKKESLEKSNIKNLFANDLANPNYLYNDDVSLIDFSVLSENEKNVAALKYGVRIGQRDISEAAEVIMQKVEKKKRMEEKLVKYYHKIMIIQNEMLAENDTEKVMELKKKEQKLKKSKNKLLNVLRTYKTYPTNAWVAEKLNLADGTVAAYINKIKVKIFNRHLNDYNMLAYEG